MGNADQSRSAPVAGGAAPRQLREQEFYDRGYGTGDYLERPAMRFYRVARDAFASYDDAVRARAGGDAEVLECGCGVGEYALEVARRGARVTGIDISPVAAETATAAADREGLGGRTSFRAMDCEALDFPSDRFDLACGEGILHHLDLDRALAEIARVLRPEGSAVFLEPLGYNPLINLYRRRTPEQRTADEHPLLLGDFELAARHFEDVEVGYFTLTSLAALPFSRTRGFASLLGALERTDRALFRALPILRRHAWIAVMTLGRPR